MDLDDTAYKVYGPKKPLWKLMDLTETSSHVNGPLVHLTQMKTTPSCREHKDGGILHPAAEIDVGEQLPHQILLHATKRIKQKAHTYGIVQPCSQMLFSPDASPQGQTLH